MSSTQQTLDEYIQQTKRRREERSEEENRLNDSLASAHSEFESIAAPTVKDLGNLIATMLKRSSHHSNVISEVAEEVTTLTRETIRLGSEVSTMKMQDQQQEREIHKLQQSNIDNDVFMAGFPTQPSENKLMHLLSTYGVQPDDIKHSYTFQQRFTPRQATTSTPNTGARPKVIITYNVVLTFDKYNKKIEFMKKRAELGPLKFSRLHDFQLFDKNTIKDPADDKTVKISNRLTKFNLDAQKKINKTKDVYSWDKISFRGGLFHLKKGANVKVLATYGDINWLDLASKK